jgi:hypothetical protein
MLFASLSALLVPFSANKPKTGSLMVTGNFDGVELVKALNAAGFHVRTF